MFPARIALVAFLSALASCGGKTTSEETDSETPSPEAADSDPTNLGECEPGFNPEREPDRSCNWLAEGRCYPTKLAACNCVCPRTAASTCSSGFPMGSGSRTPVSCF